MESTGRGGDNSIGGIDGECTHLAEVISDTDSSVALIAPGFAGKVLEGAFGNFTLNLSTTVADFVKSFRHT